MNPERLQNFQQTIRTYWNHYYSKLKRMVHVITIGYLNETSGDRNDCDGRKYYPDNYTCKPVPFFIISITLIEVGFFVYSTLTLSSATPTAFGPLPIDSWFIYRPDKRHEIWRFLSYMLLHVGWPHLCFNLAVQLLVGLPLEMVHGSVRVGLVYVAGVLAGSLGTSVFDSDVCLVGASGGVYALLAAHLANLLLNFATMRLAILRLFGILAIASCDIGYAIYTSYYVTPTNGLAASESISYTAHLTGALAGLTIGLIVLRKFDDKLHVRLLRGLALGVYTACLAFAITFNLLDFGSEMSSRVSTASAAVAATTSTVTLPNVYFYQ